MKSSLLFAAAAAVLPMTAWSQGIGTETFSFKLGAYAPDVSTTISAARTGGGGGGSVNFEQDLGLSERTIDPIVDATWRFAQRHRLELLYFGLDRTATKTIDREINIGDETYPINTVVTAVFKSQITALTYYYSVLQAPTYEVGLGAGIHNTTVKPSLSNSNGSLSTTLKADLPLPVLAVSGDWQFAPNWRATASYKWFGLSYGDYDGSLNTVSVGINYFLTKNWGISLDYAYNGYRFDMTKTDWTGNMDYKFNGLALAVIAQF